MAERQTSTQDAATMDTIKTLLTQQGAMLQEQGRKLDAISGEWARFRDAMPEAYVPRREVEGRLASVTERVSGIDTRLTAMEEYRIAETQRQNEIRLALTAQIQAAALQAAQDVANAREKAQKDNTDQRKELDTRTIDRIQGAAISILIVLLGWLLTHWPLH